jgi:hypothetical protein
VSTTHSHTFATTPDERAAALVTDAIARTYAVTAQRWCGAELQVEFAEDVTPAAFRELMMRLSFVASKTTGKTLYENRPDRPAPPDPFDALVAREDVLRVGPGLFVLQGEFLRLLRHFDAHWLGIARDLDAVEQDNPGVWPVDLYRRIDYLAEFPQQSILATTVAPNHADLEAVATRYARDRAYETVDVAQHLAPATFGLQSAVCDCCYYALRGRRDHRDTLYTTCNKVFRNERSESGSLDRLTSFTVRDIMCVGSQEYVMAQRERLLELAIAFLAELDLDGALTVANDPFFAGDALIKAVFQNAAELKYELLVRLPFSGRELAIGSVNLHQDFFGRAFGITQPDGAPVWSGCLGIGFERLVYAIYAQYGLDTAAWPARLRRVVGDDATEATSGARPAAGPASRKPDVASARPAPDELPVGGEPR